MIVPSTTLPSAESRPTTKATRVPHSNWLNTSIPWLVVPNQACHVGCDSRSTE